MSAEMIWTLVAKARRKRPAPCALGDVIEALVFKYKISPVHLRTAFGKVRARIPTAETDPDPRGARKFYADFGIYVGGDDEADYAHAVVQAGKRTFETFVNPKTTWAQRTVIARTKMCIKPGGNTWWAFVSPT